MIFDVVLFRQVSISLHSLSSPLFRFLQSLLNSLVSCFCIRLLLLYTASSSNPSSHHRAQEHLWLPRLFPMPFLPTYLISCICHDCIVVSNHAVYVYVIIPRIDEWPLSHLSLLGMCLPHLSLLTSQGQTSVLTGLDIWFSSDELEMPSSPSHDHFLCLL